MTTAWKVARSEIVELNAWDKARDATLERIIALKKLRRVELGDRVSLAFECRETVRFQVQEMLRVERIYEEHRIQDELDVYNAIMPGNGELSATLFIEITSQDRVETDLNALMGIEECLWIEVGDQLRQQAWFEPGHSKEDKISAVHYVRFKLPPAMREAFGSGAPVVITLDHPHYHARADLPPAQVAELAKDLL